MGETYSLIDADYGTVRPDSRVSSNQLRARPSSRDNILRHWEEFRKAELMSELSKMKEDLVKDSYETDDSGYISEESDRKLVGKTAAIAKLEADIKILSRESVPTNFIQNRAIKLRKEMIENLQRNSQSAYADVSENNDVFSSLDSTVLPNVDLSDNVESNVVEDVVQPTVAGPTDNFVENNVEKTDNVESVPAIEDNSSVTLVTPEDVAEVVNGAFDNLSNDNGSVDDSVSLPDTNDNQTEKSEVQQDLVGDNESTPTSDNKDSDISLNSTEEHDDTFEKVNDVNIFQNENNDDKGEAVEDVVNKEKRYKSYTPMTDEEIEKSREKIGEYKPVEVETNNDFSVDSVDFSNNIVDDPVKESDLSKDDDNLHFDFSNVTKSDVETVVSTSESKKALEILREEILKKQERKIAAKDAADLAEKEQKEIDERVIQVKQARDESDEAYRLAFKKLEDYSEALDKDYEFEEKRGQSAREEVEKNQRFIQEQEAKIEENKAMIDEIGSLIPEATNVRVRGK